MSPYRGDRKKLLRCEGDGRGESQGPKRTVFSREHKEDFRGSNGRGRGEFSRLKVFEIRFETWVLNTVAKGPFQISSFSFTFTCITFNSAKFSMPSCFLAMNLNTSKVSLNLLNPGIRDLTQIRMPSFLISACLVAPLSPSCSQLQYILFYGLALRPMNLDFKLLPFP